MADAGDGYG